MMVIVMTIMSMLAGLSGCSKYKTHGHRSHKECVQPAASQEKLVIQKQDSEYDLPNFKTGTSNENTEFPSLFPPE